jgi:hypothetical protein
MHDYFIRQNQEQTAIPCEEDLDLSDYAQNRDFLKNRKVSNVVCEVEGCSENVWGEKRSSRLF